MVIQYGMDTHRGRMCIGMHDYASVHTNVYSLKGTVQRDSSEPVGNSSHNKEMPISFTSTQKMHLTIALVVPFVAEPFL
jgi:hypothetical protein